MEKFESLKKCERDRTELAGKTACAECEAAMAAAAAVAAAEHYELLKTRLER